MSRTPLFEPPSDFDDDLVYRRAIESRDRYDKVLANLSDAKNKKRRLEMDLDALEYSVLSDERGANPEMSATAMDKHLKVTLHANLNWNQLRNEIADVEMDIDDLSADKSVLARDIEIACARLNGLGGKYFMMGKFAISDLRISTSSTAPAPAPERVESPMMSVLAEAGPPAGATVAWPSSPTCAPA